MGIFSAFKGKNDAKEQLFDNSNRFARIIYRYRLYSKLLVSTTKKGIPVKDMVLSQFPFLFRDAKYPPILALELTNYCNLKCPYCTSPLGLRKRGYMSSELLQKILKDIKQMKPNRIQLVGNGESTLHPEFGTFIKELAATKRYISLVTNGQWIKKEVAHEMLTAPLDLVEISVDIGGKEGYEKSRINGKYERLIENLEMLMTLKKELKSKTIINIRLMVRPSQMNIYKAEVEFWKKYADKIMPQYLTKINGTDYAEDIFVPVQSKSDRYPKCSMPFKHMEVKWSGEVLMCYYSPYQVGYPGLVVGNVNEESIPALWNSKIMKQYRTAHRKRQKENMEVCKGCQGT